MTSGSHTHPASQTRLRLRLKPDAPTTGYVDGAWWPRSHDLTEELTALTEALADRVGRIVRVAYGLSTWDSAPRRIEIDGFRVRLEGFRYQDRNIVHVTGSNRSRISLLVVPPETAETAGNNAMTTAGGRDNADRPEEILTAAAVPVPRRAGSSSERWESDGGRVGQR